jgi:hypothetical protein
LRFIAAIGGVEPGTGITPAAVGAGKGDVETFRRLLEREAREKAELDQFGLGGIVA